MSGFGRTSSSSQANQSSSTKNTSTNTNQQPTGAGGAYSDIRAGGNFTVNTVSTDAGVTSDAIHSNSELAATTIDAAKTFSNDNASLFKALSGNVSDLASTSESNVLESQRQALDFGSSAFGAVDKALQSNSDVLSAFQDNVGKLLSSTQATNATAFQTVAESASANVGLIDTTNNFLKYGFYAAAAIAAAVALYAISKR